METGVQVGDGIRRGDIKDRMADLKDKLLGRDLGYVKCEKLRGLPEEQKNASCYRPVTEEMRASLESGLIREINTKKDPYAAGTIKPVLRDLPRFEGLIFAPQLGSVDDIKKSMQLYADHYKLPICEAINGRYISLLPSEVLSKNLEKSQGRPV